MVVAPQRDGGRSQSNVLRLATERGVEDVSTGGWTYLNVPIEVRTDSLTVVLPKCAIRAFRTPGLHVQDFTLGDIYEHDSIHVAAAPAGRSWPTVVRSLPGVVDPGIVTVVSRRGGTTGTGVISIPPNTNLLVTLTLGIPSAELGTDALGLRLDASPAAIAGPDVCPSPITAEDSVYVEHYLLPGVSVESGGVAIAATALLLGLIIVITG